VTEVPPVRVEVTEHQMLERQCACCGQRTKAAAAGGGDRSGAVRAACRRGGRVPVALQFLSRDRTCQALGEMFGCKPSSAVIAAAAKKITAVIAPGLDAITRAQAAGRMAHFDGDRIPGRREAGVAALRLGWEIRAARRALETGHRGDGRGRGLLPSIAGVAVHDAWRRTTPTWASPATHCAMRTYSVN
jgi:transposase